MVQNPAHCLAVDIGGTKVALALVSSDGAIIAKHMQPTDIASPESLLTAIAAFSEKFPADVIGVCVPAVLESQTDRIVWAPNLPGWNGLDLRKLLQDRLNCEVFIEYDGHAAVLGEWWVGAAKGYHDVATIIIGTGIGGGFISENRLLRGRNRLAGAVGWFAIHGPEGLDHWENLASGPAIAQQALSLLQNGKQSTLKLENLTAKDVFEAARDGDALALQVIEVAATFIGQGVANVISLSNPQIVVLGGSVGQQGDLLLATVRDTVRRWAQPISGQDLPIVSSFLGEEAGLLGAAYAAFSRLESIGE